MLNIFSFLSFLHAIFNDILYILKLYFIHILHYFICVTFFYLLSTSNTSTAVAAHTCTQTNEQIIT